MFPTFVAIAKLVKNFLHNRSELARANHDLDFEIRTDALTEALYQCGIPRWICKRNAKAFMCLRPDFDLNAPKYRKIKQLLDYHNEEFINAYITIGEQHGKSAADAWMKWIRDNDVFFARIVALPDDFPSRYLFGM